MAAQYLLPGYGDVDETDEAEFLLPGYGDINETQAAPGGGFQVAWAANSNVLIQPQVN